MEGRGAAPLPRSGGGVRLMALRGGGEKNEHKALVFIVFKPTSSPSPAAREKQQAAVIVFKATALHRANTGIEPISGLVCIGQAERRCRQSGRFGG